MGKIGKSITITIAGDIGTGRTGLAKSIMDAISEKCPKTEFESVYNCEEFKDLLSCERVENLRIDNPFLIPCRVKKVKFVIEH